MSGLTPSLLGAGGGARSSRKEQGHCHCQQVSWKASRVWWGGRPAGTSRDAGSAPGTISQPGQEEPDCDIQQLGQLGVEQSSGGMSFTFCNTW